jgi:hypothetical protein
MQAPTTPFMFLDQVGNVLEFKEVIPSHPFSCIGPCPPYFLMFVINLLHHVPQPQLGPFKIFSFLGHTKHTKTSLLCISSYMHHGQELHWLGCGLDGKR